MTTDYLISLLKKVMDGETLIEGLNIVPGCDEHKFSFLVLAGLLIEQSDDIFEKGEVPDEIMERIDRLEARKADYLLRLCLSVKRQRHFGK